MRFIAYSLLAGFILVSLLALAAPLGWPFELFSHFAVQYLIGGLVLALLFAVLRRFKMLLATLALCLWQFILIAPHVAPLHYFLTVPSGMWVTSLWANVQMNEDALEKTMDEARESKDRLVALTEVPALDDDQMAILFEGFQLLSAPPKGSTMQVVLLKRDDFDAEVKVLEEGPSYAMVLLCAQEEQQEICFTFAGTHPPPPISSKGTIERDRRLKTLTKKLESPPFVDSYIILMGDFNATPWSPAMTRLRHAGFERAKCGRLQFATWRSRNPVFGLPIDHVLTKGKIGVFACNTGPDVGADHFSISAFSVMFIYAKNP
jgi:endonuclease/exonuclease/phosphatase (EEP) superfamily protein YafD